MAGIFTYVQDLPKHMHKLTESVRNWRAKRL